MNNVFEVNPTHVLFTRPESPAYEGPKHGKQGAEESAFFSEHKPGARMTNAHARFTGGSRGRFPITAKPREKIVPRRIVLGENAIARLRSVVPSGRCAYEDAWLVRGPRNRFCNQ